MKVRTWGGVVAVVGLAVVLSRFFQGFGSGGRDGLGSGDAAPTITKENAANVSVMNGIPTTAPQTAGTTGTEPAVVTVVIHNSSYRLAQSAADPGTGLDVDLDVVAGRAAAVSGNPDGIKIRILQEKTALEGARVDLLKALEQAGIKPEQIQELSGYVD